ncbi:hypothetical protein BKK47_02690 [Rodentibacter mrazii]|uniref:Uncharacterized protein n=1 Tax=Rodentibacter mrazii TaxID=1908257 RepID=A0A1V3IIV9_9PAST|nr:hypothetical protein [Rodentibacter mrazii]OOF40954.1 hypothetical protein BKK47_02690 [Rodentibacter mrazii]
MNVANIILEQLGGNAFITMTGAKNFLDLKDGLLFALPKIKGLKINRVKINVNNNDTYDVSFHCQNGFKNKIISEFQDVLCSELRNLFEQQTGLTTKL